MDVEKIEHIYKLSSSYEAEKNYLKNKIITEENNLNAIITEDKDLDKKINNLESIRNFLQKVESDTRTSVINFIEEFINFYLQLLFSDIKIKLDQTDTNGKIEIDLNIIEDGKEFNLVDGHGGGLLSIVSILLLIAFNYYRGVKFPIILDEKTAFLNGGVHSKTLDLLSEISSELGIQIILICKPNQEYPDNANIIEIRKDKIDDVYCSKVVEKK